MSITSKLKRVAKTAEGAVDAVDGSAKSRDKAFLVVVESLVENAGIPDNDHHPVRVALAQLRKALK